MASHSTPLDREDWQATVHGVAKIRTADLTLLMRARQTELLGKGTKALFSKSADGEDDDPLSGRTILPELEFRFLQN